MQVRKDRIQLFGEKRKILPIYANNENGNMEQPEKDTEWVRVPAYRLNINSVLVKFSKYNVMKSLTLLLN